MQWYALVVTWIILMGSAAEASEPALSESPALSAAWSMQIDGRVEWVEPVGEGDILLYCDEAAHIRALALEDGRNLLRGAVEAHPGVRLATRLRPVGHDGVAVGGGRDPLHCYAFDRYAMYAMRFERGDGGRWKGIAAWRVGQWPDHAGEFQGDPEVLTPLVAAHATSRGVLVARSDGLLAELLSSDGSVRWGTRLGPLPVLRMFVLSDDAALMWKESGRSAVAFFSLSTGTGTPKVVRLDGPWPVWAEMCSAGVLAGTPSALSLYSPAGRRWHRPAPRGHSWRAASLGFGEVSAAGETGDHAAEKAGTSDGDVAGLLLAELFGRTVALRARDGRVSWPERLPPEPNPELSPMRLLNVVGDVLVEHRADGSVAFRDLRSGLLRGALAARVDEGYVRGDCGYGLVRGSADEKCMWLLCCRLRQAGVWSAEEGLRPDSVYALSDANEREIRSVYWVGGRLVLVGQRRVATYALPRIEE